MKSILGTGASLLPLAGEPSPGGDQRSSSPGGNRLRALFGGRDRAFIGKKITKNKTLSSLRYIWKSVRSYTEATSCTSS